MEKKNPERKQKPRNKTPTKDLELQSSQTQMPRCQHKNTINNSQDNMSPLEPSNPTTAGPEYSNIAEAQDKDFKTEYVQRP